jgi:hypothetical protein
MRLKLALAAGAIMFLTACGTTATERAITGGALGAGAGAVIGNQSGERGDAATGAIIGGVLGAGVGAATTPNRREFYDRDTGRYYFYDRATGRYFYENGEPYP